MVFPLPLQPRQIPAFLDSISAISASSTVLCMSVGTPLSVSAVPEVVSTGHLENVHLLEEPGHTLVKQGKPFRTDDLDN